MKMRVTVLESIFPFIISVRISNDTDFIFKSQIFFPQYIIFKMVAGVVT